MLAGAALRFAALGFGLPYLEARPDEETTIAHAVAILRGDPNPHFFHWPSLTFYLVAGLLPPVSALRTLLSMEPGLAPGQMILVARALTAVAGTLTIVWMFRIGRSAGGTTMGLLSALFLSVSLLHVRESHFAMTDVIMVFFVLVSLDLLLHAIRLRSLPRPADLVRCVALAGVCGGLAASTKYSAAAIVAAMVSAQLLVVRRTPWPAIRSASAWAPAGAFLSAFVLAFAATSPYALIDRSRFIADVTFDFTHLSGGHAVDLGRGWVYHLLYSLPYGAGILTVAAALVGSVSMIRRHRDAAFVLGAFAIALYASIGSGHTVFFRYALPLIPIVCVAAAAGVERIGAWTAPLVRVRAGTGVAVVAAIVALPSTVNCIWFDRILSRTDTRVLAAEWLIAHAEPAQSLGETPNPYCELEVGRALHHWRFDPTSDSFANAGGRVPDWLVLPEAPLRAYVQVPATLRRLAADRYELAYEVRATRGASRSAVYDQQDAFFVPFSRFSTVERPGPTILVYRRVR